nr:ribonuclease H-like domain-containing protein [Tanacetum cinerariifolium]
YQTERGKVYSQPMVWIGIYIAIASLVCTLAMAADLLHGLRNKKFWFPCRFFTLNAASITVITVAMKLPVDLTSEMPSFMDQTAKLGSLAFMCTIMVNLMPSLASMDNKTLLANVIVKAKLFTPPIEPTGEINEDLSMYILQVNDEMELAERTLEGISNSMNSFILKVENEQKNSVLALLKKFTEFDGVEKFDMDHIPHLYSVVLVNSWSLPIVTLTCIAVALPCIPKDRVKSLVISVGEGLSYTHLVEESLNISSEYVNIRKATITLWHEHNTSNESPPELNNPPPEINNTPPPASVSVSQIPSTPTVNPNSVSVHPMVTRFRVGTNRPTQRLTLCVSSISPLPKSYSDTYNDPNWQNAMQDEYNALIKNNTWTLVPRPTDANSVLCMWLFRHKYLADGTLSRYKARLVANDSTQIEGVDLDVKNAFLHGDLPETVYMYQPPGFRNSAHPNYVCLLQRSLYGLKQASRAWFQRFAAYITRVGFSQSRSDYFFVHTQFKCEIKSFHCDHGGEFDNHAFHKLFTDNGIQFRFSCPRTSQQNGKSKRMIRTINNIIRTLLFQAHLPPNYWVEALNMATTLLNILPSRAIDNEIPFTRLLGTTPDYSVLRTFRDQSNTKQLSIEQLFVLLNGMIVDILSACFTNIPQVITMKCHETVIEKREASVKAAAELLGKTKKILERLETLELPSMDDDKMAYIDEWVLHFNQSIP